jgi:signal peptidase II
MKRAENILLIVLSVIALDQITKYLVISFLSSVDSIKIFPFLHLVSVRNIGAAFGMFKGLGNIFFIPVSIIAIIFVTGLLTKSSYNIFGLSFILGGAIGNLIDRILYGKVVDFIDFSIGNFHWPAFNIADSSLTIGIIIVLLSLLLKK